MQTSLLGLAIAFIIALVAALVGPHVVDWNEFRPQFEAEASRVLGVPVRVNGMLDARLLPTPTLRLRSVSVGGAQDGGKIGAEKLDVEFSLGSLLRGEWRASELSLEGVSLDIGLDKQGRIEGPLSAGRFNLGSVAIDRLTLAGRIGLYEASSGKQLELGDLKFTGDVRTLAGTMRGEGEVKLLGARTPFRISTGQSADGKGTRVRLVLDPGERALMADLDGVVTFDALAPGFDGAMTLARPATAKSADANEGLPWRASSKVKANAASATLEQIEVNYGPDDNALKFTGAGDMRFGVSPLLHVALSARQLDADRVFGGGAVGEPLRVVAGLRHALGVIPAAAVPTQIEVSVDQVAFGGRPIQNVVAEMISADNGWAIGKFEMRAPGVTRVSASGTFSNATFAGPVSIESAEPDALAAWLEGRSAVTYGQKAIRARGNVTVAPDRIAVAALNADIDGDLTGQVTLSASADGKTKLDAALTSQGLTVDPANSLIAAWVRARPSWPDEAKISLDLARVTIAGQEVRPVALDFAYSQNAISLDRLAVGDARTVAFSGAGSFDRNAEGGKFTIAANAPSLERIATLAAPFAPLLAERLKAIEAASGDAKLQLVVDLSAPKDQSKDRPLNVRAALDIDAPQVKGSVVLTTSAALDAARGLNADTFSRNEINVETKLASDKSSAMLALLGLDRVVSAQESPALFESSVAGRWGSTARVTAKLSGAVDGETQGSVDAWSSPSKAALVLTIRRADPSALFDLKPASIPAISLSSRVSITGGTAAFDDLDTTIGGSRARGKLSVTPGDVNAVDGEVGIDTLDMPSAVALAFGAAGKNSSEPLGRGWLRGWRGSLAFQALKAELPGGSELRPFGGVLKSDAQSLALDGKGMVGGGEAAVIAEARQTVEGTSFNARMSVSGADGASLGYRGMMLPAGQASAQFALTSQGRSAAALAGAMSGAGSLSIKDARIAAFDPAAFEAAVQASDDGKPTDDLSLKSVVEPVLIAGAVSLPAAQIPVSMKDGRLRAAPTTIQSARAQVIISGGYDLSADQTDIRAVLAANVVKPETGRPEIRIDLNGPPGALARTLDVASLSSWLAMRSIDRETRKLDRLERGSVSDSERELLPVPPEDVPGAEPIPKSEVKIPNRDPRRKGANAKSAPGVSVPAAQSQVQPTAAPPLPPPVNVRPPPGAPKSQKTQPLVLTPQAR